MKMYARVFCLVLAGSGSGSLAVGADPFQVDAVHSTVMFRVKHQNVSFAYGRFNDIAGKFVIDEAAPSKSSFDLTIKAESVDTASFLRDTHLKGPDFFNAKQFPTISFKSKSVTKGEGSSYDVTGDLTLHGVTKQVTFKVNATGTGKGMRGDTVAGVEASVTIKRTDFGMTYMVGLLADEVVVNASLEGSHK